MKALPVFKLAETELRPGTSLIEASAGTGKTYTIAGLFLRLIVEKDLTVDQILVVTYTVAATEELRNRIRNTLTRARSAFEHAASQERRALSNDAFLAALVETHAARSKELGARLTRALDGFDEAPIYTIHGFCQRVLKDRAFETGNLFDTELVTDQTALLCQLVEDFWRKQFYRVGRLPVVFALKSKLSPDALLPLVRSSLSRPFLKLLSPVEEEDVASLAAKLENTFHALRETWRVDKAVIRAHFGSGAKWAKRPYNDNERMAEAFGQLDLCLGAMEFPLAALVALEMFRSSTIAQGVSGRTKLPAPTHRFFDLCEELARAEKCYVTGLQLECYRYVEYGLPRRKEELKIQFFDDLLRRLQRALAGARGPALAALLRRQYSAALIDEFQDTDPLQYDIFRRIFAGPESHLFLIGDPKQSIYGFRGADIFTYLKASGQADQAFTLSENWRSESGLVRSVNTLFSATPRPFVFEGIRFQPVEAKGEADKHPLRVASGARPSSGAAGSDGGAGSKHSTALSGSKIAAPEEGRARAFQLWFWRRTGKVINKGAANEKLPGVVASEIVSLLDGQTRLGDRSLFPEDVAVLVPDNYQAELVQKALNERRVPSVLYTTASLFDSREALETQRVLAAIADPTREAELMAALATDLLGRTGSQIEVLRKQEAEWQQILERFRSYLDVWLQRGFIQMFRNFMQREQVRPRLLAFPDGERRLTNLLHLAEVLHQASTERRLGISGLLKWISEQREAQDQLNEEHQLRLETDEQAVKLVTIHKSKGLEYPVVFCPFSWKGASIKHRGEEQVFFHEPDDGGLVRDLGSAEYDAHRQLARVERLAENVRLLYVALTRAKHRCYFVWGAFNEAETSAPARLLHPPPNDQPDAVTAQEKHFEALDDDRLLADLQKLAEQSAEVGQPTIAVQDLPEPTAATVVAPSVQAAALDYRKFSGSITRDWRISSFTSLTANRSEDLPDHDQLGASGSNELPAASMFAFPAGAKPGTCLHKILELLDFTQWNQPATHDLVREQLRAHGLSADELLRVVLDLLGRVMTVPLNENVPSLTLGHISAAQRLQELEFYIPLQRLSPEMLGALLRECRLPGGRDSGSDEPEGFSFAPVQGMLKGFIDLVFQFQGRFYVVDWKSNLLGNQIEDYGPAALAAEIRRRHYYFQYQLYTAALDRYLRMRLPGYSYEQHFGGVYYLFLRGIDPRRPGLGIHRDRLKESFVRKLNRLLTGDTGG